MILPAGQELSSGNRGKDMKTSRISHVVAVSSPFPGSWMGWIRPSAGHRGAAARGAVGNGPLEISRG